MTGFVTSVKCRIESMKHPLAFLLVIGLLIRFIVAPILTFNVDIGYWAEVIDVFENGFGLYGTAGYYYTPIWGYYLGTVSCISQLFGITDIGIYVEELMPFVNNEFKVSAFVTSLQFNFIVKTPLILVDTALSLLIYQFILNITKDRNKALLGFALCFFSPLIITESSVHAMFDNMSVMLLLLSVIAAYDRHYILAGSAFTAAVFTKFFPGFFIFFLLALVIKREGAGKNGIKCLVSAIVAGIVTVILLYLPNIIRGDFWQSLYFIAYRIGLTHETLASIGPVTTAIILLALIAIIAGLLYLLYRFWPAFSEKMESIEKKERDHKVMVILLRVALVVIVLAAIFCIAITDFSDLMGVLETLAMKGVLLVSIFSLFLELYLAYRLLFCEFNDKNFITILMLSALAVIIWPCAPSYSLIIVPFVILYAVIVDREYIKPYLIYSVMMTLMETAYLTSLTSLSVYTGLIDFSLILGVFEFLTGGSVISNSGILTGVIGIFAYISMIYISIKWYRAYFRQEREVQ